MRKLYHLVERGLLLLLLLASNIAHAAEVGVWRFDEGTGPGISDESPYSNHGLAVESVSGAMTFPVGVHGNALA